MIGCRQKFAEVGAYIYY